MASDLRRLTTRFRLRSLHARLLALSAGATMVALLLAGWAMAGVLERFVVAGLDQRLDAEVTLLASAVDRDGRVDRATLSQRLGAFDAGPGWEWRITSPDGIVGSADFALPGPSPDPPPPPPPNGADGPPPVDRLRSLDGAGRNGALLHARKLTIATRRGPVELIALAPRDIVRRPIRGALTPLLAALAALAALLGAAAIVQLRLGLRPLRSFREQIAAIRSGARSHVDEDQPAELQPLAAELNALARDNAAALAAARRSAANLAHALKTPVAALALDVRDDPVLAAQVTRIDRTIRHHLTRARMAAIDPRAATPLAPAIADLVTAIRRIHADRPLAYETAVPQDLHLRVDPQHLDEMMGNCLDNAARHARTRVRVTAASVADDSRLTWIAIEDDGPGLSAAERAQVVQPGVRLDERGDGHGFGLAITAELAALYGGALALLPASLGGLLVRIELPGLPGAEAGEAGR